MHLFVLAIPRRQIVAPQNIVRGCFKFKLHLGFCTTQYYCAVEVASSSTFILRKMSEGSPPEHHAARKSFKRVSNLFQTCFKAAAENAARNTGAPEVADPTPPPPTLGNTSDNTAGEHSSREHNAEHRSTRGRGPRHPLHRPWGTQLRTQRGTPWQQQRSRGVTPTLAIICAR